MFYGDIKHENSDIIRIEELLLEIDSIFYDSFMVSERFKRNINVGRYRTVYDHKSHY
jgi:acid stress-induced BolA-like protein IbaG/YrbA